MSTYTLNAEDFDRLVEAMNDFQGNAEEVINEVLHNEGATLFRESVQRLIPESKRTWKGKIASARTGNSLTTSNGNLSVTVRSTKKYNYLYFPDDGSNTRRHEGNQQFFLKGLEEVANEVIDRCISRLMTTFEQGE